MMPLSTADSGETAACLVHVLDDFGTYQPAWKWWVFCMVSVDSLWVLPVPLTCIHHAIRAQGPTISSSSSRRRR